MNENNKPIAVSIKTAAKMLDMSPRTVAYLVNTGKIPSRKIGRAHRIRVSEIESMIGRKVVAA